MVSSRKVISLDTERDTDVDTAGGFNDEAEDEELLMSPKVAIAILVFVTAVSSLPSPGHHYPIY